LEGHGALKTSFYAAKTIEKYRIIGGLSLQAAGLYRPPLGFDLRFEGINLPETAKSL
jgi:hypothetical protein